MKIDWYTPNKKTFVIQSRVILGEQYTLIVTKMNYVQRLESFHEYTDAIGD